MTGAATSSGAASPDEALLDELFARCVEALSDGREPDLGAMLGPRTDLIDGARRMLALARRAALRGAPGIPDVPSVPGFEIVRLLGAGGMGRVYLANDVRLGRPVALKVLPAQTASGRARERFEREARAVARLDHPLIVPIHGMGEAGGQLHFSMQYVEGRTLAQIVAAARASGVAAGDLSGAEFAAAAGVPRGVEPPDPWRGDWVRACVRAAIDIADALAHAHSQGVVHRDVKPSNVIVRADGFALLFDFGLADVETEATLTLTRGFLGTPHYASPEQAAGDAASLDARSDVWSLGATLHELLTLEPPFAGPTTHEVLRRIQAWDPEPASRANPSVPETLDLVLRHAMTKDREKRYPGAAAFADDLRAVLAGRDVAAPREGLLARGLRLVQKNRALTELLVEQRTRNSELRSALRAAEDARRQADEARRLAESERDRAAAVTKLLVETLGAADPDADGRDVRVADVLAKAAERARTAFEGHPEIRAQILFTIAETYQGLGLYGPAADVAREGHAFAASALGADHVRTIDLAMIGTIAAWENGDMNRAVAMARAAYESALRAFGPTSQRAIELRTGLGQVLTDAGLADEGEALLVAAVRDADASLPADNPCRWLVRHNLGACRLNAGKVADALELLRPTYDARRRVLGESHSETLATLGSLAQALKMSGALAEADVALRRTYDETARTAGPDHYYSVVALHNVAGLELERGRLAEALALQTEVVARLARCVRPDSFAAGMGHLQLARIHAALGDVGRAAAAAEAARAVGVACGRRDLVEKAGSVLPAAGSGPAGRSTSGGS